MAANLTLGFLITAASFLIHSLGLIWLTRSMAVLVERFPQDLRVMKMVAMLLSVSGLVMLLGAEIALWAVCLLGVGAFGDFGTALYFSTSTFATVGFGDVAPAERWRLLASMEGVAGFLIIGWSSAYMVAAGIRFGPFERDLHF